MIKLDFKLLIVSFIALLISNKSIAQSNEIDRSIIQDIEKTLLFDKESINQLKFYKGSKNSKVRVDGALYDNVTSSNDPENDAQINIIVVDEAEGAFSVRSKEKLAYNTALIGQYEAAIELYKQVIESEPKNYNAKFSLAVIYQKLNQLNSAKKIYQELLKADIDDQEKVISNLLAIMIEESPKNAVYFLSRLALQHPHSPYIQAQLGLASAKIKDYEKAIRSLEKSVSISPNNLNYRYNLAVLYDQIFDEEKALIQYQEILKNYNNEPQIAIEQVRSRILSLKNNI